ncbi:MAG: hypothetical protein ACOH1E_03200 [Brevundimonas sp.]
MSLKTTAAPCALLFAAAFAVPAHAQATPSPQDVATLDSIIVTAVRNPEDPPVVGVADARTASTSVFFPGEDRSAFVGVRLAYRSEGV